MRQRVALLMFTVGFQVLTYSQSYKIRENIKKIVFVGNSITYAGEYVDYIDAYLTIHYPERNYKIINVGLPSETVSGLSEPNHASGKFPRPDLNERLERILSRLKPDLVFACYGMNDGIYMPYDDIRFDKFKIGINRLHDEVKKSGSEIIHITPPVYDERKGEAYSNVLDIYSDWLISNRYTFNWKVIDVHSPMKKELEAQRLLDSTFVFSKDGVHPNKHGHFLMAKQILLYLGEIGILEATDSKNFHSKNTIEDKILNCVEKRQKIMKNAWLTFIGHKRPNMKVGLPMNQALHIENEINEEIQVLIKQK